MIAEFVGISKEKTTLEKGGHAPGVKKTPAKENETKEKDDDKDKVSYWAGFKNFKFWKIFKSVDKHFFQIIALFKRNFKLFFFFKVQWVKAKSFGKAILKKIIP